MAECEQYYQRSGKNALHNVRVVFAFCCWPSLTTVRFSAVALGCAESFILFIEIMVDSDDEDIVEEDPADAQAESYIWKYLVDVAQYGIRGDSNFQELSLHVL